MNEWEWRLLEDTRTVTSVSVVGGEVRKGDRVLLRPRAGADIFDLALAGQTAVVESIEQDYEEKVHVAVVVEDDPGKDFGVLRQPGHRFFFTPEEIERCEKSADGAAAAVEHPKILVAGIGNIFLGDDGFGVEVAKRLVAEMLPESVRVRDFGIRGYDLAYALLEDYEAAILVDACPRGGRPGAVYVIEPALSDIGESEASALDGHTMNPVNVLRLTKAMGSIPKRIVLIGCEPASLGGDEGHMGLSEPVSAAVPEAVELVKRTIDQILEDSRL